MFDIGKSAHGALSLHVLPVHDGDFIADWTGQTQL